MSDRRVLTGALKDCWHRLKRCETVCLDLSNDLGQLHTAHNLLEHWESPLQALEAAIAAKDLSQVLHARDELRSMHGEALHFFFQQARDINKRMREMVRAIDETINQPALIMAANYAEPVHAADLSDDELAAIATGMALAAAPPGTKMTFRGVTISTGKAA